MRTDCRCVGLYAFITAVTLMVRPAAAEASGAIDFVRDVQPIFAGHCYKCHGEKLQESGLRWDRKASAQFGGDSGEKAIVPGKPAESRLIKLLTGTDKLKMPKEGSPLSTAQIAMLTRWIEQGAPWPDGVDPKESRPPHWAFTKPVRPAPPNVKRADWVRNDIDRFILARLEKEGLAPNSEADRPTLIRRVTLDLIGLPPTPAEVDAFVADNRADAYEKLVDDLMLRPQYGEKWARMWLDLARYADSAGYGSDPLRLNIWPYRDWVIRAFNSNMRFDQFTVEQIAGDLLPGATPDQILATAFHRNTMTNTEGGTDDEEFRVAAVKDRIGTTMQVWMGLTMGCAQCHSHKYDPITQREYYSFFAVFNQTADNDQPSEDPRFPSLSASQREQVAALEAKLAELRKKPPTPAPAAETGAKSDKPAPKQPAEDPIASLEKQVKQVRGAATNVPIMKELAEGKRRTTWMLLKGNFLNHGEAVQPGVPEAFGPLPAGTSANRLAVARWLVGQENPLTARVTANRFWAQIMGGGIVQTEEDFGTQGTPPSHPELLDWLAVEFMDRGWDVRALLKTIVISATYRQSARVTQLAIEKDPANRLLSHAPRHRLEAEMVRDQALSLAGLLSAKLYGPSVFPTQPGGLWRAAFNGERTWKTSGGEDRYRRGLYTFWRRTVPYPSMSTFDAPSREICTLRRDRTNTPLQALVTLNDPVYLEAAQALARRLIKEGGASPSDRIRHGLKLCLARPPQEAQVAALLDLYHSENQRFGKDTKAAQQIATDPLGPLPAGMDAADAAALTVIANVLLNLDGVLTKG